MSLPNIEIVVGNYYEPLCHTGCTWCQNYAYLCEGIIFKGWCPWDVFTTEEEKQRIMEVRCLLEKYNNFEVLKFYGNNLEKIKEDLEKKKDKEDYEENMKAFEKALKTPIEEMKKYLEENFPHYQDDEIETYFHRIERKQYELDEEEDDDYMDNEDITREDSDSDDLPF